LKTAAKKSKQKTEEFDFSGKDVLEKIISGVVRIADPDKIILFGSRATGKARKDSDYDILVLKKNVRKRRKLAQLLHMNLNAGVPLDILVNTPKKFEDNKEKWYFVDYDIHRQGRVVYEK